jgi:hypothetical protein
VKEDKMNETKHTSGPWKETLVEGEYWIMGGDGLNVVARFRCVPSENNNANARLIAAAPEMLDALKLIEGNITSLICAYPEMHRRNDWGPSLQIVRDIIAKAEGK